MKRMATVILTAALLFATSTATALRITDSSTADKGAGSTYSSLNKINSISTAGYQNTYGVPVGMIVAWSSQREISSYDSMKWLECNGQTFNRDQYPELYEALGVNVVPNLNGQFMRGTSDKNLVLTRKDDTIKSHTVNIPEHTHTFDLTATGTVQTLTNGETVYVPQLPSAEDTIKSSRIEKVKTGTEQYVCGTEEENYECNCRRETYQCGEVSCVGKPQRATCYRTVESPDGYGWTGSYITVTCKELWTEPTQSKYCNGVRIWHSNGHPGCPPLYYFVGENPIKPEGCGPKYCTREIDCQTCTRTVDKYCTRDVYSEQLVETEGNPAKAINTTTPSVSHLQNGTVSGQINSSGELIGNYEGAEETAPKHTYVRYFIRAIP